MLPCPPHPLRCAHALHTFARRRCTCNNGSRCSSLYHMLRLATTFRSKASSPSQTLVSFPQPNTPTYSNIAFLLKPHSHDRHCTHQIWPEDVWKWLRGPFLAATSGDAYSVRQGDTSQFCNQPARPSNWTFSDFGVVGGSKIIAPVYMRQLRVPKGACPASPKLSSPTAEVHAAAAAAGHSSASLCSPPHCAAELRAHMAGLRQHDKPRPSRCQPFC